MAESAFLDDGSHLDQNAISADRNRRNETCWPFSAAASRPRTLSLTMQAGLPYRRTSVSSSRATRTPDSDVSATSARHCACSRRPRTGCGSACCRRRCPRRSPGSSLVRPIRQHHRCPGAEGTLHATAAADPQVLLAIYPQQLLVVGRRALPRQQIALGVDSRNGGARPPVRVAAAAADHRPDVTIDNGSPAGTHRSDRTPDARSSRDVHWHGRRPPV